MILGNYIGLHLFTTQLTKSLLCNMAIVQGHVSLPEGMPWPSHSVLWVCLMSPNMSLLPTEVHGPKLSRRILPKKIGGEYGRFNFTIQNHWNFEFTGHLITFGAIKQCLQLVYNWIDWNDFRWNHATQKEPCRVINSTCSWVVESPSPRWTRSTAGSRAKHCHTLKKHKNKQRFFMSCSHPSVFCFLTFFETCSSICC